VREWPVAVTNAIIAARGEPSRCVAMEKRKPSKIYV
jgi:hypothetical protein